MVYILWGHAYKQRPYGVVEPGDCPTCGDAKPFRHRVIYKLRHFGVLARWVTERRYANQCQTCGYAERVPQKVAQQGFKRPGIPIYDRWGWAAILAVVAVMLTWMGMVDEGDKRRDEAMLAQPAVNDLYDIDLAQMTTHPERVVMDALVRVDRVDAHQVTVRLPNTYYDGYSSQLTADSAPGGAAHSAGYFSEDTLVIDRAALVGLREKATIMKVAR